MIVLTITTVSTGLGQSAIKDLKPTVILISLDGFRYDYVDKYEAPNIAKLARERVRAKWMIPSFPTKTFPNHYTVVTGLYPANHGIVENNVYDFGTVFTMGKREEVENPRWWGGEPIWVTAEKQGQVAASFFWVGSEAKINGVQPTYWKTYDGKIPNEERVDTVLGWLDLPRDKRPTMITLYFSDTDDAGHAAGPDSENIRNAVKKVDGDIARLVDGLTKRKIGNKVNVIITSDHGMANVTAGNLVYMYRELREEWMERDPITTGEIWQIFPKPEKTDEMMEALAKIENTTCWKKSDLPERFHYKQGVRVAPVICSAKLGWTMSNQKKPQANVTSVTTGRVRGAHGFDNQYQEMQAVFIAHGPAFKRKYVAEPFENVEVYNVMCKILGLKPAKNDGKLDRVKKMMR
ncbi:MAG: alkaline phosphatase family protein [Pyrinomonadaceae bacterium]|nr:alkaline phosphatase family protein [Acidobacteriota bacterium]MBP7377640.1 alkaline phosphatase family protein [Pyrinomonadaceae bacterium]